MTEQTSTVDDAAALGAALERVADAGTLLVALDFDGTLAPFRDRPEDVAPLVGSWAAVLTLERAKRTHVALVSGRPLDSLAARSGAPADMALVGSHGAEWRVDGHEEDALSADEQEQVARVGALLDEVGARHPRVVIEHKPAGHAVHTRRVSAEEADAAQAEARDAVSAAFPGVTVRGGKDIVEFGIRQVTKGDAIARLRASLQADAVLYAGDDVTDEDAFRELDGAGGDVGVKVGEGETLAGFRVADPEALTGVLKQLARLRATR